MIYSDQTDVFAAFKRDGAIPKQAQRDSYRIAWTDDGRPLPAVTLWRTGIRHAGSHCLYERPIASMRRHCVWC